MASTTAKKKDGIDPWLFERRGKSIDILNCKRWYRDQCHCAKCAVCNQGKHSPYHGPVYGQPVGSTPWGHEFIALDDNQITKTILKGLGR